MAGSGITVHSIGPTRVAAVRGGASGPRARSDTRTRARSDTRTCACSGTNLRLFRHQAYADPARSKSGTDRAVPSRRRAVPTACRALADGR